MAAFPNTKPHYEILDGLRGVAAIMVVWFHIFEAYATSHLDQRINHGYLAVDFFFILSGFVIGYAYDDRWGKMKITDFIKRRVIRCGGSAYRGRYVLLAGVFGVGCVESDYSGPIYRHIYERVADSGDSRNRSPGLGRDVSVERAKLVSFL